MAALPARATVALEDGRRLAVLHGGACEVSRSLFASTPDEVLVGEVAATGHDGVVAGHCGLPFARVLSEGSGGGALWVNAGAVGMPGNDGTARGWFAVLTPSRGAALRVEVPSLRYDHAGAAAAMRAARLPEGYADALGTGRWPSLDVLPPAERAATGVPLRPASLTWPVPVASAA